MKMVEKEGQGSKGIVQTQEKLLLKYKIPRRKVQKAIGGFGSVEKKKEGGVSVIKGK